jgi:hypothetical protein
MTMFSQDRHAQMFRRNISRPMSRQTANRWSWNGSPQAVPVIAEATLIDRMTIAPVTTDRRRASR